MITGNIKTLKLIDRINALKEKTKPSNAAMERAYYEIGMILQARIVLNIRKKLYRRSRGQLRNSIGYEVFDNGVRVFSAGVPYARIHEFGGTIKAKKRFLTIPLSEEYYKTSAGKNKNRFSFIKAGSRFFLKDKINGEFAYLLRNSVRIPARPYFYPAIQESRKDIVFKIRQALALGE